MTTDRRTEKSLPSLADDKDASGLLVALSKGASPNQRDANGRTALHYSASWAKPHFISKMILYGCSPVLKDDRGYLPLHYAVAAGNLHIVNLLARKKVGINARLKNGLAPIHMAIIMRDMKMLRVLLNHGANPNIKDGSDGMTPQKIARDFGFIDAIAVLGRAEKAWKRPVRKPLPTGKRGKRRAERT